MPRVDDRWRVELGDAVRNGFLGAAEGEDNQSSDKQEQDVAPEGKIKTTGVGLADG